MDCSAELQAEDNQREVVNFLEVSSALALRAETATLEPLPPAPPLHAAVNFFHSFVLFSFSVVFSDPDFLISLIILVLIRYGRMLMNLMNQLSFRSVPGFMEADVASKHLFCRIFRERLWITSPFRCIMLHRSARCGVDLCQLHAEVWQTLERGATEQGHSK